MNKKLLKKQNKHLEFILKYFDKIATEKYKRGAIEHDNNLFNLSEKELVDEAIYESVDQIIYLLTLRKKIVSEKK